MVGSGRVAIAVLFVWAGASCAGRSVRDGEGASGNAGTSAGTNPTAGRAGDGGASPSTCAEPTDCELVEAACCPACEPVTLDAYVALNASYAQDFRSTLPCGPVACSPCPPAAAAERAWLGATCRSGRCVGFDARTEAFTACDSNDDCRLRTGLDCCEACLRDDDALVAVSDEAALESLVCPSDHPGCDDCGATYPADRRAYCVGGRCITGYIGGN